MPRSPRITPAGYVYHVLNRGVERRTLFSQDADYEAFREILRDGMTRYGVRLVTYALLRNHWHLVLWPETDDEISPFMHWVTSVHSLHIRRGTGTVGRGHLYQDRYKSFPVQEQRYYWKLLHYVEANPLRAGLVSSAQNWTWSGLYDRLGAIDPITVDGLWPLPDNWLEIVNHPIPQQELDALRESSRRGRPFGSHAWMIETAQRLRLERSLRSIGAQLTFEGALRDVRSA